MDVYEFDEYRTNLGETISAHSVNQQSERYNAVEQSVARICYIIGFIGYSDYIKPTSFDHLEAIFRFAEGSTYRVDKTIYRDGQNERVVAVKRVKDFVESNTLIQHELLLLRHSELRKHPNIATSEGYGWGISETIPHFYLVEEFAAFGTLETLLRNSADITFQQKVKLCQDVVEGIRILHKCKIAHGDVKIENTLVFAKDVEEKGQFTVRISDFGHAMIRDGGQYLGTPLLVAPEVRGAPEHRPTSLAEHYQCDIYSYGLLVWEVLLDGMRFYKSQDSVTEPRIWIDLIAQDELLRLALCTLHRVGAAAELGRYNIFRSAMEAVLLASIQYQPENRMSADGITKIFRRSTGDNSRARMISQPLDVVDLANDDIPDFRALRLTSDWPAVINEMVMRHLEKISLDADERRAGLATYCLAMCHGHGITSNSSIESMLENLKRAAFLGHPQASLLYPRIYHSHGLAPELSPSLGSIAYESELQLQLRQNDDTDFCLRLRVYEQKFQEAVLGEPFELYAGEDLVANDLSFISQGPLQENVIRYSKLLAINELTIHSKICEPGQIHEFSLPLLHCAARLGLIDLVELLLSHGADPNNIHETQHVPLLHACKGGHSGVLHVLIDRGAFYVSNDYESPLSFLFMLPEENQHLALQALLGAGFSVNGPRSNVYDNAHASGKLLDVYPHLAFASPIYRAIATKSVHLSELLLQAGARYCTLGENMGLNLAVSHHILELTEIFLRCGSKTTEKDFPMHEMLLLSSNVRRMLHGMAATRAFESTLDALLKTTYSVNDLGLDESSLLISVLRDFSTIDSLNYDVLQSIIDRGGRFDMSGGLSSTRVVHVLSNVPWAHRGKVLEFLILKGVIQPVYDGEHLACAAADLGQTDMISYFLEGKGAGGSLSMLDINHDYPSIEDELEGRMTLLSSAIARTADATTVRYLLEHGADPNKHMTLGTDSSLTCLQVALGNPGVHPEVIDLLFDYGVDLYLPGGMDVFTFSATCKTKLDMHGGHPLSHMLRYVEDSNGRKPRHPRVRQLFDNMVESGFSRNAQVSRAEPEFDPKFLPLYTALGAQNIGALEALFNDGIKVPQHDPLCGVHFGIVMLPRNVTDITELSAARRALARVMRILLERAGWGSSWPPLHTASIMGHTARVIELLDSGENVLGLNSENQTARQAAENCLYEVQRLESNSELGAKQPHLNEAVKELKSVLNFLRQKELAFYFKEITASVRETRSVWNYPEQLDKKKAEVESMIHERGLHHDPTAQEVVWLAESYLHLEQWQEATKWYSLVTDARDQDIDNDAFVFKGSMGLLKCRSRIGQSAAAADLVEYCQRVAHHYDQAAKYEVSLAVASLYQEQEKFGAATTVLRDLADLLLIEQLASSTVDDPEISIDGSASQDTVVNPDRLKNLDVQHWQDLVKLQEAIIFSRTQRWDESRSIWAEILSRESTPTEELSDLTEIFASSYLKLVLRRSEADIRTTAMVQALGDLAIQYEASNHWDSSLELRRYCYEELNRIYGGDNFLTQKSLRALTTAARKTGMWDEALLLQETILSLLLRRHGNDSQCMDILATQATLAEDYSMVGRFNETKLLFDRTVKAMTEKFGPQHETTLETMERYLRCTYHPDAATEAGRMAWTLYETWSEIGQTNDAAAGQVAYYLTWVIDIGIMKGEMTTDSDGMLMWLDMIEQLHGSDDTKTLFCMQMLALSLVDENQLDVAEQLCLGAHGKYLELLGVNRVETVIAASCLRLVLHSQDRDDEADSITIGNYQLERGSDELSDLRLCWFLHYVAQLLSDEELYKYVKDLLDPIWTQIDGNDLSTGLGLVALNLKVLYAMALFETSRSEREAERIFQGIVDANKGKLADDHRIMRRSQYGLVRYRNITRQWKMAQASMDHILSTVNVDDLESLSYRERLDVLDIADNAVRLYEKRYAWHRVIQSQRIAYEIRKLHGVEDEEDCIEDLVNLVKCQKKLSSWTQAISHQKLLVEVRERTAGKNDSSTQEALNGLVELSFEAQDWATAESALDRLLATAENSVDIDKEEHDDENGGSGGNDDDDEDGNNNETRIQEQIKYRSQLAELYSHTSRWTKAEELLERNLSQIRTTLNPTATVTTETKTETKTETETDTQITTIRVALAKVYLGQHRLEDCDKLVEEIISTVCVTSLATTALPDGIDRGFDGEDRNFQPVMDALTVLCRLRLRQGRFLEARVTADEVLHQLAANYRDDNGHQAMEIRNLQMRACRCLGDWGTAIKIDEDIEVREAAEQSRQLFLRMG